MAHRNLSESDIVGAAKQIAACGEIPTIAAVRRRLNGRGSETTILNYLRKWKIKFLAYAVYFEESDIDPQQILQLKHQNETLLQTIGLQNEQLQNLTNQLAHFQTENMVLQHGIKRLNSQRQEMQHAIQICQTKIEHLQELNQNLNAIDALVAQTQQNQNLRAKLADIKQDLQLLRQE